MNKTAIKNFAIWARRELISRVSQKAAQYGITENDSISATADAVHGKVLSETEKKQRMSLIARIHRSGYSQTMEEIAYTWFNRFCALRFMEVNSYLPSLVRVFSDEKGNFKPQILESAIDLELDGLDREKVFAFKKANQTEELYQYLLITQCNALSSILPGMFQRIDDETELLCPDNLLREGSVIAHMVCDIPESDWLDAVQIIGWLYQFYNTEQNELVYDGTLSKSQIPKELLPAATTIYTPDWAVRYMVDNSLGKLWVEGHPGSSIKQHLKFFIDDAEGNDNSSEMSFVTNPESIPVIDPCMGSGHILVYMFDVLMLIYHECGYNNRDAVACILSKNLFGLDIDDRAAQLAYFAVMMKARQYDTGFFRRQLQPKVYAICESNEISARYLDFFCDNDSKMSKDIHCLIETFRDAKEYGSILKVPPYDASVMNERLEELKQDSNFEAIGAIMELTPLLQCAELLSRKYMAVVTNPPYLGSQRFSANLRDYVNAHYKEGKSDLSAVMFKKAIENLCESHGVVSFITTNSWFFIKSFEDFRQNIIRKYQFESIVDFGTELFEGKVGHNPIVSWVSRKKNPYKKFVSIRLVDYCFSRRDEKEDEFFNPINRHITWQIDFQKIPGSPVAYWVSNKFCQAFKNKLIADYGFAGIGMRTGDNARFLRFWFEVSCLNTLLSCSSCKEQIASSRRWIPYNKGGEYRKWYGNNEYVVNWLNNGEEIKENTRKTYPNLGDNLGWKISNESYYYRPGITWSGVTSAKNSFRAYEKGFIFDSGANGFFPYDDSLRFILAACLNTCVLQFVLKVLNPTINTGAGTVKNAPAVLPSDGQDCEHINLLSHKCVGLSKKDWDSYETSWDFQENPLIEAKRHSNHPGNLYVVYGNLRAIWEQLCETMREYEVENNRIFIDLYGLQDELSPEVPWNEITLTCNPWYRYGKTPELEPGGQHFSATGETNVGTLFAMQPVGIKVSPPDPIMKVTRFPFNQELEDRLQKDTIKELISYAVGCMFGRYSLDVPGLVYAGGKWDASKYASFPADDDNIIPICDNDYFKDDLSSRFVSFIETVYGSEALEENLTFIAKALGGQGSSREVIRKYFREEFFADHCKMYQKRPIYWLFDSGKKGGFRALIYMHRYQPDMLARLRTDYIHEQQERYRTAMADLEVRIDKASSSEKIKLEKQLREYREKAEETRLYEEKIHHLADKMISIDLDDGVKHNYAIFQDVLAKIK